MESLKNQENSYYAKYNKYKKKYLELKQIQYSLNNQIGSWSDTDPNGDNFPEASRTYYDVTVNPDITKTHISNTWSSYKLTNRYKIASGGELYNLYNIKYLFPLDDMSNKFFSQTVKANQISSLDKKDITNIDYENLIGLSQIYFANTIRDMSNVVNNYVNDPDTYFSDLSHAYYDLKHDIDQRVYYFIPTRAVLYLTPTRNQSLKAYHDKFYGFDVSSSKASGLENLKLGLSKGVYDPTDDTTRLEYLKINLDEPFNKNIRETEEHNLKILKLLMDFHKAKEDGKISQTEITSLKAQISGITASLTNEQMKGQSLANDYRLSKQVADKEIKTLKDEREKRNNAISRLGKYMVNNTVKVDSPKKSNVITLGSFFGLN